MDEHQHGVAGPHGLPQAQRPGADHGEHQQLLGVELVGNPAAGQVQDHVCDAVDVEQFPVVRVPAYQAHGLLEGLIVGVHQVGQDVDGVHGQHHQDEGQELFTFGLFHTISSKSL